MPATIASSESKPPMTSLSRRGLQRIIGVALIIAAFIVADTASAQGPLRRLGDRIRERAGGPVAPGINEPAAPLSPPASPPGRRPLLNGPLRTGPAARPAATGPVAGPAVPQSPPAGRAPAGATRSANYNRAAVASQRMADPAASRVEQSSAWESRQDFRGSGSRETVPPVPREPQSAPAFQSESLSSGAPIEQPASRARLGVVVDSPPVVTPPGLPPRRARGALVSEVQPDSAAAVAGIAVGDLIVSVDGRVVTSVRDLTDQLSGYKPGDEARFQITREERLLTADVTLAGPDGIALRRPETSAAGRPTATGSPSIMNGLGAAIGGLFGGPANPANAAAPQAPSAEAAENSPSISPETVRNSLPESLPPPAPEKDED